MPDEPTWQEHTRRWQEASTAMLRERRRPPPAMSYLKWVLRVLVAAPILLVPALLGWFLDWVMEQRDPGQQLREWRGLFRLKR